MRVCIIGCGGSMGKRRVRDFLKLNCEVCGYDIRQDRREEAQEKYGIQISDKIPLDVDAWIISVPPKEHISYMRLAAKHNIPFFVEAGALPYTEDFKNGYISATLRFHPLITWMNQKFTNIKKVKWECRQDIRLWHPNEDIKNFYVGEDDIALREMCVFELQAITYLFGWPKNIESKIEKVGETCIKKDKATLSFETDKGIKVELLVDLVSPILIRQMHIEFTNMERDWPLYLQTQGIIMENTYKDEIKCFIDTVEGKTVYPYSIEEDKKILELIHHVFEN